MDKPSDYTLDRLQDEIEYLLREDMRVRTKELQEQEELDNINWERHEN